MNDLKQMYCGVGVVALATVLLNAPIFVSSYEDSVAYTTALEYLDANAKFGSDAKYQLRYPGYNKYTRDYAIFSIDVDSELGKRLVLVTVKNDASVGWYVSSVKEEN